MADIRTLARPWRPALVLLLTFLLGFLLAACGERPPYRQQSYVFGTLVEVSIQGEDEDRARRAANRVLQRFDAMHRQFHAWEPGGLEAVNQRIAQAAPGKPLRVPLSPELAAMLRDATTYAQLSDHLFNPAIGNLVRLWGFHADEFKPVRPDPSRIDELVKANPRLTDLTLDGDTLTTSNPAVRLDLGGYAKGYALDLAADILHREGVRNALVNIGGNIIALGQRGDRPWRVGIQHPRRAGAIATLELADGEAIGTSGDYQRYFELDGRRYCHLIDPRTGWPARGAQAVTVLVRGEHAGTRSDVVSKPLFIAGTEGWPAMARRLGISEVLFIDPAGHAQATPTLARRLTWVDNGGKHTGVP